MNVILITLKRTTLRSQLAIRRLNSLHGISPHVLWASDGSDPDSASSFPLDPLVNRHLLPGEAGCVMSFWRAAALIVRNNWPRTIVLEDDAVPSRPDFSLYHLLCSIAELPSDFDLALLHNNILPPFTLAPDGHTTSFQRASNPAFTCSAICLSNKGARTLLKALPPFDRPIDEFFHYNPSLLVAFQPYQHKGWFDQDSRFHSTIRECPTLADPKIPPSHTNPNF